MHTNDPLYGNYKISTVNFDVTNLGYIVHNVTITSGLTTISCAFKSKSECWMLGLPGHNDKTFWFKGGWYDLQLSKDGILYSHWYKNQQS